MQPQPHETNPAAGTDMSQAFSVQGTVPSLQLSGGRYNVTEIIERLLLVLCLDVSSSKRNNVVALTLLNAASELFNGITNLIEVAYSDVSEAWESYNRYTAIIPPLEKFLLQFSLLAEEECLQILPAVVPGSVDDCITSFQDWIQRREKFCELLKQLDTLAYKALKVKPSLEKFALRDGARRHDDISFLSSLCDSICNPLSNSSPAIKMAQHTAGKLPSKIHDTVSDDLMIQSIRLAMLLHWTMATMRSPMETRMEKHLKSAEIRMAATGALSSLIANLELPNITAENLKQLRHKINEFENLLKTPRDWPQTQNILGDLMKSAKLVRRPFHSQTLVVIEQCRALVDLLGERTSIETLKEIIERAKQAIDVAACAMTSIGKFEEDIRTHDVTNAFRAVEGVLQEPFVEHKLAEKWNELKKIDVGVEEDVLRVEQMNAWLERSSQNIHARNSGTVVVKIIAPSKPELNCERMVDDTTRLSALLWERATKDATVLRGSYFAAVDGKESHRLVPVIDNELVKTLPFGEGGVRVLHLIVR